MRGGTFLKLDDTMESLSNGNFRANLGGIDLKCAFLDVFLVSRDVAEGGGGGDSTSDTNLVVALLSVFSIGVASA